MQRLIGSGALVLAAVAVGCGPEKELPDLPKQSKAAVPQGGDPHGVPPAATDPAAKAVLDRAVKAIADGDPVRIARGRAAKVTYQGGGIKLSTTSADLTPTVRVIEAVWPDSALVADDFKGQLANNTFYLRGQRGWLKTGLALNPASGTTDLGRVILTDLTAWHWMTLGLPLADPAAVAFEATKKAPGTAVKVALPSRPVYLVTFDEATGLPVRVEFHPVEQGVRVHKVFTLADHKSFGGLILATRIEMVQDGVLGERWAAPTWEFPDSIPPSRFDPPKE
ncbi:unnamed protein product [Gemmataceae bacterium]|nr:unnamed protein product [Gemmataceae bacterium]VTT99906.1 unnamed protein product [Gemmataceae bacterium]